MRRREFLLGMGGVAASAIAARGQQPAVPVVGMLSGQSADGYSHLAEAVRLGLKDEGFVDGQNVRMEYRWAAGRDELLPAMAVELVNRPVAVLLTGGSIWSTFQPKLPRQPFRLYSARPAIRSNLASLQASTGQAAMSWLRCKPQPARRQCHGRELPWRSACRKASGIGRAAGAQGGRYRIYGTATRTEIRGRQKSYRECRCCTGTKNTDSRYRRRARIGIGVRNSETQTCWRLDTLERSVLYQQSKHVQCPCGALFPADDLRIARACG